MAAPAQTSPDALDPSAPADPIALAAFVSRRGGRVVAYLDAVTTPDRALHAAGEAFAAYRQARAADPDGEPEATTLLRAVRRAATAGAENPYRPEGRERPARRTRACEAMPRLLVAWTEGRLPDGDVARLVEHLQDCPDCRELRDAFDRAEIGYRGGESVDLDGTAVGVIATAMALATAAAAPPASERTAARTVAPAPTRPRRTAIPAPPSTVADHLARPSGPAPVGRRTAIPAPPTAVPVPPTAVPVPPTAVPAARARDEEPPRPPRRVASAAAVDPDDPLGPEALGYAVPRSGLPRPARRPAVPRVKRRRARRPASAAVAASAAVEGPTTPAPADVVPGAVRDDAPRPEPRDAPAGARPPARDTTDGARPAPPDATDASHGPAADRRPERVPEPEAATATVVPATIGDPAGGRDGGRLTVAGRRALQTPVVRQLGVPAVLLLVVLIAALIAAGAFAGDQGDSVDPVTRPSIQSVPSDPNEIPPLR